MTNLVLQSMPIYWFSLLCISVGVISSIRRIIFNYLWQGKSKEPKYHLVNWEILSRLLNQGGWGIKQLGRFNKSLCAKRLWQFVHNEGIWGRIIRFKYLQRLPVVSWLRSSHQLLSSCSMIWRSLVDTFPIIKSNISLLVGRGTQFFVGIDLFVEMGGSFTLSVLVIQHLHERNIFGISHIVVAEEERHSH